MSEERNASDIPWLVDRVLSLTKGEAREWMIELAGVLNRTVPCSKCDGKGWHRKHRNCRHSAYDADIKDCYEIIECKKCRASGRLPKPVEEEKAVTAGGAR
jgi:hypothetical protein